MVKTRSETDLLHLNKGNTLVLRIWKSRHKHTDKTRITYALQWFLYVKLANEILGSGASQSPRISRPSSALP